MKEEATNLLLSTLGSIKVYKEHIYEVTGDLERSLGFIDRLCSRTYLDLRGILFHATLFGIILTLCALRKHQNRNRVLIAILLNYLTERLCYQFLSFTNLERLGEHGSIALRYLSKLQAK